MDPFCRKTRYSHQEEDNIYGDYNSNYPSDEEGIDDRFITCRLCPDRYSWEMCSGDDCTIGYCRAHLNHLKKIDPRHPFLLYCKKCRSKKLEK